MTGAILIYSWSLPFLMIGAAETILICCGDSRPERTIVLNLSLAVSVSGLRMMPAPLLKLRDVQGKP